MKILIVTNHFYPEVFRVNDVAFEFIERGHDVTVITSIPNYPQGHYMPGYGLFKKQVEFVNGVKVIRVPVIPRGSGTSIRLFLNYLSFLITASLCAFFLSFSREFNCIFVHETSPVTVGIPAVILKWRQRIPLYFWVLDLWPESLMAGGGISNRHILGVFKWITCLIYKNSDKILISSQGFKQSILEKGDFEKKIVYFPNWGEDIFTTPIDTIQLPELPNGFNVMYAGNLGEAQGFETIMEAALLLRKNSRIKWIFIGSGRKKKYIEDFVRQNHLENTIYLLGTYSIEKIPSFFSRADILLVALKNEMIFNLTVPAKLQAYMASSKAVCAVLNGEAAEIVKEARNGCVVPTDNPELLAEQIVRLSECTHQELEQLGKNGFDYYNKYFRKDICMNNLCRIMNM